MLYPSMHYLNNNQSYNSLHRKKPAEVNEMDVVPAPLCFTELDATCAGAVTTSIAFDHVTSAGTVEPECVADVPIWT